MTLSRLEHTGAAPAVGLAVGIGATATSFTVTPSGNGYPTGAVGNFWVCIDPGTLTEEHILCSSRSGTTFAVAGGVAGRGLDNTTAQSHLAGAVNVEHIAAAVELDDDNDHLYTPTRDDHTQYLRTDSTRAGTGTQSLQNLTVVANETVGGTLGVTGAATVGGTLGVTGAATLASTLGVTGAATLGSTLAVTGGITAATVAPGITGATAAGRYVGTTAAGAPSTGTFVAGDWVSDQTGAFFVCIVGGTPGTWSVPVGGVVGTASGPTATTQVVNQTKNVTTLAVSLVNGLKYEVTASAYCTIITNPPNFVNASVIDSGPYVSSNVFMSYNSTAYIVGSVLCGSGTFNFTAGATGTDTFNISCTSNGAGSGVEFFNANQCNLLVRRIA